MRTTAVIAYTRSTHHVERHVDLWNTTRRRRNACTNTHRQTRGCLGSGPHRAWSGGADASTTATWQLACVPVSSNLPNKLLSLVRERSPSYTCGAVGRCEPARETTKKAQHHVCELAWMSTPGWLSE